MYTNVTTNHIRVIAYLLDDRLIVLFMNSRDSEPFDCALQRWAQ